MAELTQPAPSLQLLAETVARLTADLDRMREAGLTRSLVDVATGVLMGRHAISLDEAHERLLDRAGEAGIELLAAAAAVLDLGGSGLSPQPGPPVVSAPPASGRYLRAMAAFETAATADELAEHLATAVTSATGPAAAMVGRVEPNGTIELVGSARVPSPLVTLWRRIPPDPNLSASDAARRGEPVWLPDLAAAQRRYKLSGEVWPSRCRLPLVESGRTVAVAGLLWRQPTDPAPETRRFLTATASAALRHLLRLDGTTEPVEDWVHRVQAVLDVLPGSVALIAPVRSDAGDIVDLRIVATSPDAADVADRRGPQMVGRRVLEIYPTVAGSPAWDSLVDALATGTPRTVGPFNYTEVVAGVPRDSRYSVRIKPFGAGLVASWHRHDADELLLHRIAQTERMGLLGWASWDLRNDEYEWSEQLYRIFERDPAAGPIRYEEFVALVHPDDRSALVVGIKALIERGVPYDLEYRIEAGGRTRTVRAVAETVRDATGRAISMYGVMQDLTPLRDSHRRLEQVSAALVQEHRLAIQVQEIILPVPAQPVMMPGLRVGVRYLPAERAAQVGGDWFHAEPLPGGEILLAVGDVAGHGLPAASVMAQLRHALVGLTVLTASPAAILTALNTLLCERIGDQTLATAIVGMYLPAQRRLRWSQAGHLPFLLAGRDGVVTPERPFGLLLGAYREARYVEAEVVLDEGDLIIMFTDGLIEGPDTTITAQVDELATTIADLMRGPPEDPLATVLAALHRANPNDDSCLLVAQATAGSPT